VQLWLHPLMSAGRLHAVQTRRDPGLQRRIGAGPFARPMPGTSRARGASDSPLLDARLRPLAALIGDWSIRGRTLDSAVDDIRGATRIRWSAGGTFQEHQSVFEAGGHRLHAREIVTHDRRPGEFSSWVFSDGVNKPLEYRWTVRGDVVSHSGLGATFRGEFGKDGKTLSGGWRPDRGTKGGPGSSYDVVMNRISSARYERILADSRLV
jgi:hypothetical protein